VQNIKNELTALKSLKSSNIVELYDTLYEKPDLYMILEFCPDGDLHDFINKTQRGLEEQQAIHVLKDIMKGFKVMADNGYIHRDIKPANILLKGDLFKITDFGFACKADISGNTLIRDICGSPMYEAPQLLQNKAYTAKSDI